jgi:hypothetical protein
MVPAQRRAGADPNCTDFDGKTPLHGALEMQARLRFGVAAHALGGQAFALRGGTFCPSCGFRTMKCASC